MKKNILLVFLLLLIFGIIYKIVFTDTLITGGDYVRPIASQLLTWQMFSFYAWNSNINLGWGIIPLLASAPSTVFLGFIGRLVGDNEILVERIVWWLPFLIIGFASSCLLFRKIFGNTVFSFFAALLYLCNTYILLIISGGQIAGIGQAYSFAPFVILLFISLAAKPTFTNSILTGIALAVSIMFDLRMTYILLVGVGLFLVIKSASQLKIERLELKKTYKNLVFILLVPGIVAVLMHAYWLIPMAIVRQNPLQQLGSAYDTTAAVRFFSFAKFENTLGLLHPNWPENIFGLVHFMEPEFLVLPILAFGSLLFLRKKNTEENKRENMYVVYFSLLALIGAFLAKGANDPFGGVYLWMFGHIPGFMMFRDSTKWYMLVALSYSILIPYTLWKISEKVSSIKYLVLSKYGRFIVGFVFIIFWLFTIRQAVFGQLGGTFKPHTIPQEYIKLEEFLSSQKSFFRTFWIPSVQRYGFYSQQHPGINAEDFFHVSSVSGLLDSLQRPQTEKILQDSGVKYVIVPYDSEGELFVKDRVYNEKMYQDTIASVSAIPWLTRVNGFGRIAVFMVPDPKGHFWLLTTDGKDEKISYTFVNPTKYSITLHNVQEGDRLVFSESYDKNWEIAKQSINSQRFEKLFNSFVLLKSGSYDMTIEYGVQRWVNIGLWISIITVVMGISLYAFLLVTFRGK